MRHIEIRVADGTHFFRSAEAAFFIMRRVVNRYNGKFIEGTIEVTFVDDGTLRIHATGLYEPLYSLDCTATASQDNVIGTFRFDDDDDDEP